MCLFAPGIEHPLDMTIERLHDTDAAAVCHSLFQRLLELTSVIFPLPSQTLHLTGDDQRSRGSQQDFPHGGPKSASLAFA
jgi:hypothetical protein